VGYCQYDSAYYNAGTGFVAPTMTLSGTINGVILTPVVYTAASANAGVWNLIDKSITNSSGADGQITITFSVQSAVTTGKVYWDGIALDPMVTKARHYGFVFDEANPKRTVNITTSANEATAQTYSGVTVSWGATSSITAFSADKTFQYLYDYTQYQACLNLASAPPLTGAGVAGSPALSAQGNVTITTGYKLNGAGSISMGSYTLSSELAGLIAYTYTGGTWSQLTTVPTVNGGQLNIGAAGTYTLGMGGSTIYSMAPTAASTYNMSSGTFTGTVDLRNKNAYAITVQLPAGTTYITSNNTGGAITVSAPVVSQGLAFTGLTAGSQVKVFTTATTTELFSTTNSATSETFSQTRVTDITVDYTIFKDGYVPIRVTGILLTTSVLATPINHVIDRTYVTPSGLTFGTTATVTTGTKTFTITVASTVQNWYSFMIQSWRNQSALANTAFPLLVNGPNSFTLGSGWVFGAPSIALLSRDGLRYLNTSGNVTAIWAAVLSSGVPSGRQVRFEQINGGAVSSAATTGNIDQLVQILSDPNGDGIYTDGYDYRGFLALKAQENGYDQGEANAVSLYGNLEDQLYVVGLNPVANGIGAATITGATLTDHGATPVTWNGKVFSLTITDTGDALSGTQVLQYFRGLNNFNYHDLVQKNGSSFKTVNGATYGGTGAATKGVRVVRADGVTPHASFDTFTADDGTTFVPAVVLYQSVTVNGLVAGSRVQVYSTTTGTELYNAVVAGTTATWTDTAAATASRAIRIRLANVSGATAYQFVDAAIGTVGILSTNKDLTYLASQTLDTTYNTNALDGSLITGMSIIDSSFLLNITAASVTWPQIYAYQAYWLSTSAGIIDQGNFISSPDTANYLVSSFKIKNTSSPVAALTITGGYGRSSSTGLVKDIIDTTGGSIFPSPDHAIPYSSGSGLTAGQAAQLTAVESKTNPLTFTGTALQADVKKMNGATVLGTGTSGDKWRG
jgi:hypothetical protein